MERERVGAELRLWVPPQGGPAQHRVDLIDRTAPVLLARITIGQAMMLRAQLDLAIGEAQRRRDQPTPPARPDQTDRTDGSG